MIETPRALIFLLSPKWMGISRLPQSLLRAGFQVATLSPAGSFLSKTRYAHRHVVMSPKANVLEFLLGVIGDAKPDLIIPGCEAAVHFLHQLERGYFEGDSSDVYKNSDIASVRALVRRSLGAPENYSVALSKHALLAKARVVGLRAPEELEVYSVQDALAFAQTHGYPVVLKKEYGAAGRGVRICNNDAEIKAGLQALATIFTRPESSRVMVQQFIRGYPVMQVFSAMSGKILERMTVVKEFCHPAPTGPSCVVRFIEAPEMNEITNTLLAALGFSGYGSLEFIVDENSQLAFLMEMNARPCPISHLGHLVGRDITRALYCHLTGDHYEQTMPSNNPERIALFPQEWLRDPQSPLLTQIYHDVPWDDPELLRALTQ